MGMLLSRFRFRVWGCHVRGRSGVEEGGRGMEFLEFVG